MSKFALLLPTFGGGWLRDLWLRYHFKFVLPRIQSVTIEGIQLDVSSFSPKIRNRIMMGYEEAEKQLCREMFTTEDAILEVGGGIGFIGLFCRKRLGIRNYISVEANPATIGVLKRNYELNGCTPEVWNFALGESDGVTELNTDGDFWEHFVAPLAKRHRKNGIQVPSVTLPTLLGRVPKANALIIDIEGAETHIDFAALPDRINKLLIELHPHLIGRSKAQQIVSALTEADFCLMHERENSYAFVRHKSGSRAF